MITNSNRLEVVMVKRRKWSVALLGMCMVSMSGVAIAGSGHGGSRGAPAGDSGWHGGPPPGPPAGSGWHGAPPPRPPGGAAWHGGPPPRYGWPGSYSSWSVGITLDPFFYGPWFYPGPYYYPPYNYPYPPVVSVPATPPVYIERAEVAEPASPASASWYYCNNPQGYYPYVENCPGGWQAVAPRPPAASGEVK
jgi:hypothetical protein